MAVGSAGVRPGRRQEAAGRVLTPVCVAGGAWDGALGAALASGWR